MGVSSLTGSSLPICRLCTAEAVLVKEASFLALGQCFSMFCWPKYFLNLVSLLFSAGCLLAFRQKDSELWSLVLQTKRLLINECRVKHNHLESTVMALFHKLVVLFDPFLMLSHPGRLSCAAWDYGVLTIYIMLFDGRSRLPCHISLLLTIIEAVLIALLPCHCRAVAY